MQFRTMQRILLENVTAKAVVDSACHRVSDSVLTRCHSVVGATLELRDRGLKSLGACQTQRTANENLDALVSFVAYWL